ncbi:hypothetical protein GGR50DRAFT_23442 [Xylaria sp. CBS 124048]|nr:hypothetical protein GGR50DRAFT_23442 [Xylaria sp. CBS 124048]
MTKATGLASRIAYNSVYAVLCLILSALLLVVPGDIIRQALTTTHQVLNLIVLAIVYVTTVVIVLFVYALRLYVTRTVLASIPKPWIPIEKGDVNQEVRDMIVSRLDWSAAIAFQARPKVLASPRIPEVPSTAAGSIVGDDSTRDVEAKEASRLVSFPRSKPPPPTMADELGIPLSPSRPVWGDVEHYGWSSPALSDLPNIQYATVLAELPNLIEAKAVTQAPTYLDPMSHTPLLDPDAVILLQRASNMTVRGYLAHLTELDVLPSSQSLAQFLDLYERVRFSGHPMSNATFRRLMQLFADLLRAIRPLDPSILFDEQDDGSSYLDFDGHIDDHAPRDSAPTTRSHSLRSSSSFDRSSLRSHVHAPRLTATRRHYRTAPTTPRSPGRSGGALISRSSSGNSGQSRRSYAPSGASTVSLVSTSAGSVIRLSTADDAGDLPYVLRLADTL